MKNSARQYLVSLKPCAISVCAPLLKCSDVHLARRAFHARNGLCLPWANVGEMAAFGSAKYQVPRFP